MIDYGVGKLPAKTGGKVEAALHNCREWVPEMPLLSELLSLAAQAKV